MYLIASSGLCFVHPSERSFVCCVPPASVPPPSPPSASHVRDLTFTLIMSHNRSIEASIRQIQNNSSPASPTPTADNQPGSAGQHATSPTESVHPPELLRGIVAQLFATRTDFAAIVGPVAAAHGYDIVPSAQGSPVQPGGQPGVVPPLTSPPTVEILGERTREERDAELRLGALSLRSNSSPSTPASSIAPTVRHAKASSPVPLITADAIPDSFKTSPSFYIIPQVLNAPMDPTVSDWRSKIFYEAATVAIYERWLHPSDQPHTDAALMHSPI